MSITVSSYHVGIHLRATASGADIPEELFDLVLDFLVINGYDHKNWVAVNKRDLGHIALVCRRWAKICQQKIFAHTTLRSRQDFFALWSFVDHPESIIKRYIQYLWLDPVDAASAPWIHVVCQRIPSRMLHPEFRMTLELKGREEAPLVLGRSIHGLLPKHPLPIFSFGIKDVHLTDMRFRSLEDLARLVGEMPSLRVLECERVTWPPLPEDRPYLASFVTLRSRNSVEYWMHSCTDSLVVMLFSSQIVPLRRPRLGIGDCSAMYRIACVLTRERLGVRSQFNFDNKAGSGGERINKMHV